MDRPTSPVPPVPGTPRSEPSGSKNSHPIFSLTSGGSAPGGRQNLFDPNTMAKIFNRHVDGLDKERTKYPPDVPNPLHVEQPEAERILPEPVPKRFYQHGHLIFKENSSVPAAIEFAGRKYFAMKEDQDSFFIGKDIPRIHKSIKIDSVVDWNKELASYKSSMAFGLPQHLPGFCGFDFATESESRLEFDIDDAPILPPGDDESPKSPRDMKYSLRQDDIMERIKQSLAIADTPGQNQDYAHALRMFAASEWVLSHVIGKFNEINGDIARKAIMCEQHTNGMRELARRRDVEPMLFKELVMDVLETRAPEFMFERVLNEGELSTQQKKIAAKKAPKPSDEIVEEFNLYSSGDDEENNDPPADSGDVEMVVPAAASMPAKKNVAAARTEQIQGSPRSRLAMRASAVSSSLARAGKFSERNAAAKRGVQTRKANKARAAQKSPAPDKADEVVELPRYLQKIPTKDQEFVKSCHEAIQAIKDVEVKGQYTKWFLNSIKMFEKGDAEDLSKLADIMACIKSDAFKFFKGTAAKFHHPLRLTFDAIMKDANKQEKLGKFKACIRKLALNKEESNERAIKALKVLVEYVAWPSPSVEAVVEKQTTDDTTIPVPTEQTGEQKESDAVEPEPNAPGPAPKSPVQQQTESTVIPHSSDATSEKPFEELTEEEQIAICQQELAEEEGRQLEEEEAERVKLSSNKKAKHFDPMSGAEVNSESDEEADKLQKSTSDKPANEKKTNEENCASSTDPKSGDKRARKNDDNDARKNKKSKKNKTN